MSNNSRTDRGRTYWTCAKKKCYVTLNLLHDKFTSTRGEHRHEPNEEKVLSAADRRRAKDEKKAMNRLKRLEVLKRKELERRNRDLNGLGGSIEPEETPPVPVIQQLPKSLSNQRPKWTGSAPVNTNPETSVFDTGSLDTGSFDTGSLDTGSFDTGSFDTGSFDTFAEKLEKHLNEIHSHGILNHDHTILSQNHDLMREWVEQRRQINELARMTSRNDTRFEYMRARLDHAVVERDCAVRSQQILEERLKALNTTGAQVLINQITEIQGKDSVYKVVNGAVAVAQDDGLGGRCEKSQCERTQCERTQCEKSQCELEAKYERAVKERDALRLKLKNLASAAASSLSILTAIDDSGGKDAEGDADEGEESNGTSDALSQDGQVRSSQSKQTPRNQTLSSCHAASTSVHCSNQNQHQNQHQNQNQQVNLHTQMAPNQCVSQGSSHHQASVVTVPTYSQSLQGMPFHGWHFS